MSVPDNHQYAVDTLRGMTGAKTTDLYNGQTYWSDDQLYTILLNYYEFRSSSLLPVNIAKTKYKAKLPASLILDLDNIEFDLVQTPTYNSLHGTFDFTVAPTSNVNAIFGVFNMNAAAAAVWQRKAEQRSEYIDMVAGANKLNLQQEYNHCVSMAQYYRARTIRSFK